jgi:hypothetical protein
MWQHLSGSHSRIRGWILQDKVVNEMEELYQFMRTANQVLDLRVGDERETEESQEDDKDEGLDGDELIAKRKEQEEQVLLLRLCTRLLLSIVFCCEINAVVLNRRCS